MNQLGKVTENFRDWVWHGSGDPLPLLVNPLRAALQTLTAVARDLGGGQLSLRAMSLVYTTVIAIVPLLALSFSVLKGFGLHQNLEPALLDALIDLGDKRYDIVGTVMGFIDNVNVGVLGAVGFAILIYSVMSMMHKIESAFNYTWRLSRSRELTERVRDYLSVIFVAPLLIFLSAAVTTTVNTNVVIELISALPFGGALLAIVGELVPYLLMSIGFAIIYMFLPNTRVKFTSALVGGLVTSVIWKTMGWAISLFVANSASNVAIYSAFASIIVLMVWMYVGWLVLLVGCSVAFYHQNPQYLRRDKSLPLSTAYRQMLAVEILYRLCAAYDRSATVWSVDKLAADIGVNSSAIEEVIDVLVQSQYVYCLSGANGEYLPAKPSSQIIVEEVCRRINAFPEGVQVGINLNPAVVEVCGQSTGAVQAAIGDVTIASLIAKTECSR